MIVDTRLTLPSPKSEEAKNKKKRLARTRELSKGPHTHDQRSYGVRTCACQVGRVLPLHHSGFQLLVTSGELFGLIELLRCAIRANPGAWIEAQVVKFEPMAVSSRGLPPETHPLRD